jgi:hypothetical protein
MAFLNIPIKSIEVSVNSVIGTQAMPWYNPQDFPVQPLDPYPTPLNRDYRWRVTMSVVSQPQSSYITRDPGVYNGQDITVGQWIGNLSTGQAWQIILIESKTTTEVTAIVQDIYRYNTFRDVSGTGTGGPNTGTYVVFNLSPEGLPQIDPVPASGTSPSFTQNIQSRFEYINLQYDYPLYQAGNTFAVNDVIAGDSNTNSFVLSDSNNKVVVGRVTSISDTTPGWFTINPVQKIVDNLDYLPGSVGDIIYSSTTVPGELTLVPEGPQIYVNLRQNTQSISRSVDSGPTTPGNVFQLNGYDITIGGIGAMPDVVSAVNAQTSNTGVSVAIVLSPTVAETNNALVTTVYGEPALWATSSPATATINGVLVTFNVPSTDPGYEDYARPAQMAQVINSANIPNIVASTNGLLKLVITNIVGGSITIVNGSSDINGVPFGGSNSASGIVLFTPVSVTDILEFTAIDARAINFLDVVGSPLLDFGLISVENGIKACGLYIEQGLRESSSTVVTNLTQLNALSPLVGDQSYVIDSDDGQGNNVGEWSMWIYNGSVWIETANQGSAETDAKSLEYTVLTSTPSVQNIGEISTGRRVTLITVEVITPFDGPAALSVGYLINNPTPQPPVPAGLMPTGLIDLTVAGTYTTSTDILFGTDTVQGDVTVRAYFDLNGSTVGAAQIIVSYV